MKRLYINVILRRAFLVRTFPFRRPPILLLSYPRSGSSWIGAILAHSRDVAYLREPITQAFQAKFVARALMDPGNHDESPLDCLMRMEGEMLDDYLRMSDEAFAGIPPRDLLHVVNDAGEFGFLSRRKKNLLIKEVNPLATELLVKRHAPKTVVVLRHPAAIADSFERIGWLDRDFEEFGYQYGKHMAWAVQMSREADSIVVLYEELAHEPVRRFPELFSALGLCLPEKFDNVIGDFCENEQSIQDPHEIRRSSQHEPNKWKKTLNSEKVASIMRGYLRSPLAYYRDALPTEAQAEPYR